MNKITYRIYPPQCANNCSDRWYVEIRNDGWLIDFARGTAEEVKTFAEGYQGTQINPKLHHVYLDMMKKYGE